MAQSQRFERTRRSLTGATDAAAYAELIDTADLELLDTRTLSDTVNRPVDPALRTVIHRYAHGALRHLHDVLAPADVEALTRADERPANVVWGDTLVTSTRTLLVARPTRSHQ